MPTFITFTTVDEMIDCDIESFNDLIEERLGKGMLSDIGYVVTGVNPDGTLILAVEADIYGIEVEGEPGTLMVVHPGTGTLIAASECLLVAVPDSMEDEDEIVAYAEENGNPLPVALLS